MFAIDIVPSRRALMRVAASAGTCLLVTSLALPASAQRLEPFWVDIPPSAEVLESPDVPRTSDGLPDIFAEWTPNWRTIAPNGREPRELLEGDRIQPEDFASEEEYLAWVNRDESEHPALRCELHGGARIMSTPYKLEIVRAGENAHYDKVIFLHEQFNIIRRAYMDAQIEPDTDIRGIWGTSHGEWQDRSGDGEMDTLFVETTGLNGSWLEQTGLVYSDESSFTEEYWLNEDGSILHMLYTLTDPVTYSHPIQHHIWWDRATTDGEALIGEYVCNIESAQPQLLLERYLSQNNNQ